MVKESLFFTAGDRRAVHSRIYFAEFFQIPVYKSVFEITSHNRNLQLLKWLKEKFFFNQNKNKYLYLIREQFL